MSKRRASLPKHEPAERTTAERRKPIWPWIAGGLFSVALVAALVFLLINQSAAQALPGQYFPIQSRDHIQPGQAHPPYNSDPPTSGWHYDTPWPAGFYEQPVPDEQLVHNLEHGYIVISYDCSKLTDCAGTKEKIRQLMQRYNNWKITAVPRKNADAAIALTAWGWLDKLDSFDEKRMTAFINAHRDRGPERTPD